MRRNEYKKINTIFKIITPLFLIFILLRTCDLDFFFCHQKITKGKITSIEDYIFDDVPSPLIRTYYLISYEFTVDETKYKAEKKIYSEEYNDYKNLLINKEFDVRYCINKPDKNNLLLGRKETSCEIISLDTISTNIGDNVVLTYKFHDNMSRLSYGKDTCSLNELMKEYKDSLIGREFKVRYFLSRPNYHYLISKVQKMRYHLLHGEVIYEEYKEISIAYQNYKRYGKIINSKTKNKLKNKTDSIFSKYDNNLTHETYLTNRSSGNRAFNFALNHEFNVNRHLVQENGKKNVGRQISLEFYTKNNRDTLFCIVDFLINIKNSRFQIADFKSSRILDLSQHPIDTILEKYSTKKHQNIYKLLKKNKVRVKPIGDRATQFFQQLGYNKIPNSIKVSNSIDFYVNDKYFDDYDIYKLTY